MNLNAIRAFVYTAQTGSISAAAKRMGRSRVQLSQWITNLEIDWNTTLLSREGHKPELTEEGKSLLNECKQMLRMEQYLAQKVDSMQEGFSSELTIGVSHYLGGKAVVQAVEEFNQRYPNIDCHFFSHSDEDLMDDPNRYTLSLGYYTEQLCDQFHVEHVCEQTLLVVCGSDHPLAMQEEVSILDLNQYTAAALRKNTEKEYWPTLPDQKCWYADDAATCIELTKENLAIMLVPKHRIERELDVGELVIINHPQAVSSGDVGVFWQKPYVQSEPERYLVECIKKAFTA